jgi:C-terminal processing protease CtpA/Prc
MDDTDASLNADELTNLTQQVQHVSELTGSKQCAGIGLIFQSVHPCAREFEVLQPIEGSPAHANHQDLPGDVISSIDSIEVFGFELSKVADFLRGPEQSTVRLGLRRKMLTVHIDIKLPKMCSRMLHRETWPNISKTLSVSLWQCV